MGKGMSSTKNSRKRACDTLKNNKSNKNKVDLHFCWCSLLLLLLLTLCIVSKKQVSPGQTELTVFVFRVELVTNFNLLENTTSKKNCTKFILDTYISHMCMYMYERERARANMEMKVSVSEINTLDIFNRKLVSFLFRLLLVV